MNANAAGNLVSTHRILDGRYAVGEVIGWGGMADVHLGRDLMSGRVVAVKVLHKDIARDPLFHSRFRREAQALAGLDHPAIVSVYDTGFDGVDDGAADPLRIPFIVLEYVAGQSLRELVKASRPSVEESIRYLTGILSALEHSHAAGVIHRDIKPGNVMITPEGAVKVVDFGIARANNDSATTDRSLTFLGTPAYASPEQFCGETGDARSDLYSAGCLLYELLAGRPPFVGDHPLSVVYQHVHEEPARVSTYGPHLAPALDAVLHRALAKDREDRFPDARAFEQALQAAADGVIDHDVRAHAGAVEQDDSMALTMGSYEHADRRERCA